MNTYISKHQNKENGESINGMYDMLLLLLLEGYKKEIPSQAHSSLFSNNNSASMMSEQEAVQKIKSMIISGDRNFLKNQYREELPVVFMSGDLGCLVKAFIKIPSQSYDRSKMSSSVIIRSK